MWESFVLGAIQGMVEWLPVSSEGMLVLAKNNWFGGGSLEEMIKLALFLHLGTFFAAFIYFKKDVVILLQTLFSYKKASEEEQKLLKFLIGSTLLSGSIGFVFLKTLEEFEQQLVLGANFINVLIGGLLLITGILLLKSKNGGPRSEKDLTNFDTFSLGLVQAFAALPGFSRSGLTVSTLLLRHFNETTALRLSFLMSLPLVLGANIVLNLDKFVFNLNTLIALGSSFVFGLLTIHLLLAVAKKMNFGYFVLIFGILMIFVGAF